VNEKILGYLLLAIGLVVIIYAGYSVSSVFSGKTKPFNLFNLEGISIDLKGFIGGGTPTESGQQLENDDGTQKSEIISSELVNEPLNVTFYLLFMGFVASIGFKVASLGVMLVRPIKVKMKETS